MQLTSIQMLMWIDILRMINKWNVTISTYRSSRPEVFCKRGVLGNFTKFTGKHLCQRLFLNKVAGQRLFFNKVAGPGLQLY